LAKKCDGWWIFFGDFRKKYYFCAMKNAHFYAYDTHMQLSLELEFEEKYFCFL